MFLEELCEALDELGGVTLQVVDDGSGTEETARMRAIVDSKREGSPCLLPLLELPKNLGKGGAVYAGWEAAPSEAEVLAFVDADGSCSAKEVLRLSQIVRRVPERAVFASRLKILGRKVERKLLRHLMGRVYATFTSIFLDVPVYDSQCGLKFVPAKAFQEVAGDLKSSGFSFDAELMITLLDAGYDVVEEPIDWHELPGGTVSLIRDPLKMFFDILEIRRRRKLRRGNRRGN